MTEKTTSLDLIYEETRMQIDRQLTNFRALDAKANVVTGIAGIILGLVVSGGIAEVSCAILRIAVVLLLLLSVLSALLSMWIVGWRTDPLPDGMRFYEHEEPTTARRQFLSNMREAYKVNLRKTNRKAWSVKIAMASLVLALVLVGVAVVTG